VFLDSLFDAGADNFTQSRILGSVLAFIMMLSARFHSITGSRRQLFYSFNHFLDLDCTNLQVFMFIIYFANSSFTLKLIWRDK